jgi:hypothetical protein
LEIFFTVRRFLVIIRIFG